MREPARRNLIGEPCYAGLDLGVTGDMSALSRVFPNELGGVDILCRFWAPREGRWQAEPENKIRYPLWEKAGWLIFTEGEATDFDRVESDILEMHAATPFRKLCADRAYASHILSRLFNNHGMDCDGIPQGPITLNEPMMRFESMMIDRTLRHMNNPVLNWNIANATVKTTSTGLMHIDKSASTKRIDGLAATINAIAAWLKDGGQSLKSVYETRGILRI